MNANAKWIAGALAGGLLLAGSPTAAAAQSPPTPPSSLVADGARVYGRQCVRCHTARSPQERTDREWQTIVGHMRTRANLTRSAAEAVTAFLQATNLPEGVPSVRTGSLEPAAEPDSARGGARRGGGPGG